MKFLKALIAILAAGEVFAAYLVPTDGSRSWGDPDVWYKDAEGTNPLGSIPTTVNGAAGQVYLCGTGFTPEDPIVIGAGTHAKAYLMQLASKAGETVCMRIDEGGMLGYFNSSDYGHNSIGRNGKGVLTIDGGSWSNNYSSVGYAAGSEGVVTNIGGKMYLFGLVLGYSAGAKGSIVIEDGMLSHANWNYPKTWAVGRAGEGVLELKDGTIDGSDLTKTGYGGGRVPLHLGTEPGGHGTFRMSGGYLEGVYFRAGYAPGATGIVEITGGSTSSLRTFDIGYDGVGKATVSCNWTPGRLHLGYRGNARGTLTVCAGVTNAVSNHGNYDDGMTYIGGRPDTSGGYGELILSGGTFRVVRDAASTNMIWIGCNPTAFGTLRGWGRVMPSSTTTDYEYRAKAALGNGTIVADGFGENRLLDFGDLYGLTNYYANPASGTNGWYAVNKGRVHFPTRWDYFNVKARALGTAHSADYPDFVNSVVIRFTGNVLGNGRMYGGVYAPDRDDIHADTLPVPEKGAVVGVWKLGMGLSRRNWDWDNITRMNLHTGTIGVDFRYDLTRIGKETSELLMYRREGEEWKLVGRSPVDPANPVFSVRGLDEVDDPANIGLFALVERPRRGITVFFR